MLWARTTWQSQFRQMRNIDLIAPDAAKDLAIKSSEQRDHFWRRYLAEVLPSRFIARQDNTLSSGMARLNSPKPIEDVTNEAFSDDSNPLAQFEWDIDFLGQRVILVDLGAADEKLTEGFTTWLASPNR